MKGSAPSIPTVGNAGFLTWEAEFELRIGKPYINLNLKLNWFGEASRVRLNLTTTVDSSEGIYEIPFGTVRRNPYRIQGTSRGEWPAHRFVALENQQHGLALINTGAAGVEVLAGKISTTVIRAPKTDHIGMLIDDTSSQHGQHHFEFGIVPYQGSWADSTLVQAAQEINEKLRSAVISEPVVQGVDVKSWVTLSPSQVVLSAIKRAENGSDELIVRMYETTGHSCTAELFVYGAQEAWKSNLLEQSGEPLDYIDSVIKVPFASYEIVTVRIRRSAD